MAAMNDDQDSSDLPPGDEDVVVRAYVDGDREAVDRLFSEGLLPGHVGYNSEEAQRVRAALQSGQQRMWVAEAHGQVIGTIALIESDPGVGQIHCLRVQRSRQADRQVIRRLREAVAAYAREAGLLKLVLHVPPDLEQRVIDLYTGAGFLFSRARDRHGRHLVELYLNIYHRPSRSGRSLPRKR